MKAEGWYGIRGRESWDRGEEKREVCKRGRMMNNMTAFELRQKSREGEWERKKDE